MLGVVAVAFAPRGHLGVGRRREKRSSVKYVAPFSFGQPQLGQAADDLHEACQTEPIGVGAAMDHTRTERGPASSASLDATGAAAISMPP